MENYNLEIINSAQKELKSLEKQTLERIINSINELKQNPYPANHKKLFNKIGYRIRVGDYRIIYTVMHDTKTICIMKVGHRKDVYK